MVNKLLTLSLLGFLFVSCGTDRNEIKESNTTLKPQIHFNSLDHTETGIDFQNTISENEEVHALLWDAIFSGGGVAIFDLNNDGLSDLFFSGNQESDALYLNKGDLKFEDITSKSGISEHEGWSSGVSVVDINEDGWMDLYVCRTGWLMDDEMVDERRNKLLINNGDLTFTEKAKEYGLDHEGYSTQATWLDHDHDGDLDMFLLNAPSNNLTQKVKYNTTGFSEVCEDQFFRNDGEGKFVNASKEAGVDKIGFGLGVIASDLNHDNWVDIYVANDYDTPDRFYVNNKDGTFTDMLEQKMKHTSFTAMGVDAGDINNDCLIDLAVVDMQSEDHYRSKTNMPSMSSENFWNIVQKTGSYQYMTNTLQLNNGIGFFSEIAQLSGIASTDWSWAVLAADFDLDGWKDIYVSNGINKDIRNNDFAAEFQKRIDEGAQVDLLQLVEKVPSTKIANYMFHNQGDLTFSKVAAEWGVGQPSFSFGAAYGDLDNDGDLDIVVNNNNDYPFLLESNAAEVNNWLKIKIDGGAGNPKGYGSKAVIFYNNQKQYAELTPVRGYESSSEPILHFGVGESKEIDSLVIIFPDGNSIKRGKTQSNETLLVNESDGKKLPFFIYGDIKRSFTDITDASGALFNHREDDFDDYEDQILLPHSQSKFGPCIAKGDVNGDGQLDFYIGGAAGQSGQMNYQEDNHFKLAPGAWNADAASEDVGATFFDLEGDGDLDLYVVSGGGHLPEGSEGYQDRLYVNQGNSYTKYDGPLPSSNGSIVIAGDADGDNDMDLFIGGRGEPGRYPFPGKSYLLINEAGVLMDKTAEWNSELSEIGMVTDACWEDIDADGDQDLLIVGEWMAPTFLENIQNKLVSSAFNEPLLNEAGWWNSVTPADIDKDGKIDFVLGNIGMNNKYHPNADKPLKIYGFDFDHNNTNDIVLAKSSKGTFVPVRGRQCSSEQMPFIADKYSNFESYATASLEEIYGVQLDSALFYEAKNFHSGILHNTGSGFEIIDLPALAQIAPIMGCVADDFNKDGHLDLVVAGNLFDAEVETTRHDSGNGLVLLGDGDFNFSTQNVLYSGFYAPSNVRCLESLSLDDGTQLLLVGANNNKLTLFKHLQ